MLSPTPERRTLVRFSASVLPRLPAGRISLIDGMGAKAFVARAEELAEKYGSRFLPSEGLKDMAARGKSFYRQYATADAA